MLNIRKLKNILKTALGAFIAEFVLVLAIPAIVPALTISMIMPVMSGIALFTIGASAVALMAHHLYLKYMKTDGSHTGSSYARTLIDGTRAIFYPLELILIPKLAPKLAPVLQRVDKTIKSVFSLRTDEAVEKGNKMAVRKRKHRQQNRKYRCYTCSRHKVSESWYSCCQNISQEPSRDLFILAGVGRETGTLGDMKNTHMKRE